MKKPTSPWPWRASAAYMAVLSGAALVAAFLIYRFLTRRVGSYSDALSRATEEGGFEVLLFAGAPIGLVIASVVGVVVGVFAYRRSAVCLVVSLTTAAVTVVALYWGTTILRDIEGGYYRHSAYVRLYKTAAIPLGILSLAVAGYLVAVLVLAYRRKDPESAPGGD